MTKKKEILAIHILKLRRGKQNDPKKGRWVRGETDNPSPSRIDYFDERNV